MSDPLAVLIFVCSLASNEFGRFGGPIMRFLGTQDSSAGSETSEKSNENIFAKKKLALVSDLPRGKQSKQATNLVLSQFLKTFSWFIYLKLIY